MDKISIILVNYHTSELIKKILKKLNEENFEVVIWNNSPSDKIENHKNVKVINSKTNIGFGPAINRAIKYANSEYVLLLNPDCDFEIDVIYKLYEFLKNNDTAFAVSPKVLTHNNKIWPTARKLNNPFLFLFARRSIFRVFKKFHNEFLYLNENKEILEVEGLCATFLMLKKSIFLKLNGFDEKFFFYAEDVDLSLRARRNEYKLFILNNLIVYHSVGITRKIKNSFTEFKRAKSLFLFLVKNYLLFKIISPLLLIGLLIYLEMLMLRELFDLKVKDPLWK